VWIDGRHQPSTTSGTPSIDNGGTDFGLFVKDIPGLGEVKSVASNDMYSGWSWTWKPRIEADFTLQDFVVRIL
jgi:hypothetical protein